MRAALPLLLLSACTSSEPTPGPAPSPSAVEWHMLSDGSSWATSLKADEITSNANVGRCWPSKSGFDCLLVHEFHAQASTGSVDTFSASRISAESLAGVDISGARSSGGYSCSGTMRVGIDEAISRDGSPATTLVTNPIYSPIAGRGWPWSRGYVEKFMADNSVGAGTRWLDCRRVVDLYRQGSIQTFSTTAATRSLIGP